jgi:hypothetical protein
MTETFAAPFTLAPLAPLASAPAPAASGPLVPSSPVGSDWSATKRDNDARVRGERRSAIERARHSAEAGWSRPGQLSKQERLAQAVPSRNRQAGSENERRDTRSAVARAIAKVENVASDKDFALSRTDREDIRQRHGDVGEFIKHSEQWEKDFKADPVGTREKILATYAGVSPQNFRGTVELEKAHGARGSIQRAQRDQG